MSTKPKVLLTNDDGIHALGLKHLWNSLKGSCDLYIAAPASEQSGVGLAVTLREPLHIESVSWEDQTPAWKTSGTPADCVRLATKVISETAPDIVVSGINRGSNAGRNLLYSGTVGGAIEACMRGVPSIAFSCCDFDNPNYQDFEIYVSTLVQYLLKHPLPKGSFLNVSFPICSKEQIKGCRLARQGLGYYKEDFAKRIHPEGRPYYWMGGTWEHHEEHSESDVYLLAQGYITAVPISIYELTNHSVLEERKDRFEHLFKF